MEGTPNLKELPSTDPLFYMNDEPFDQTRHSLEPKKWKQENLSWFLEEPQRDDARKL